MPIRRVNDVDKQELNHEQFNLEVNWASQPPTLDKLEFTDPSVVKKIPDFEVRITAWNKYILCEFKCGTVAQVLAKTGVIERVDTSGSNALNPGMAENTKFEVNIIDTVDYSIRRRSKKGGATPNADDLIVMKSATDIGQQPYTLELKENGVVEIHVNEPLHGAFRKRIRDREGALREFMVIECVRKALNEYRVEAAKNKDSVLEDQRFVPWLVFFESLGIDPLSGSDHEDLIEVREWCENAVEAYAELRKSNSICKADKWFMK